MISKVIKAFKYYKNPKYRVMKGGCINNRCVLFLGAYPSFPYKHRAKELKIHGYCDEDYYIKSLIEFKNQKYTYLKRNKLYIIWTFKDLIKWRRLLPKNNHIVLEKRNNKWYKVIKGNNGRCQDK